MIPIMVKSHQHLWQTSPLFTISVAPPSARKGQDWRGLMAKYTGTSTQDADLESEAWAANNKRLG